MKISLLQPLLSLAVFGVAVASSSEATAQNASGWYGAIAGSASFREDSAGTIANAPTPGSTVRTVNPFEPGFGGQLAVGRQFGRFRLEGEVGYVRDTQNRYEAIVPATGQVFASVSEKTLRGMLNGYVDFPIRPFDTFVGLGLGYVKTDLDFIAPRAPFPTEQPRRLIDDSDSRLAYQLMAGISIPVSDTTKMTVQYRWLGANKFEGHDSRGEKITREMSGGSIDAGIRLLF